MSQITPANSQAGYLHARFVDTHHAIPMEHPGCAPLVALSPRSQVDVVITARTAVVTLSTLAATRVKPVTTTITVTGPAGPKASGLVTLRNGATTLGTALLRADGTASVTSTPGRAGPVSLVATYAGDSLYDSATSAPAPATVAKSAATLTFSGKLKSGKAGKVKVAVTTVSGVAATGKITIKVGTKSLTKTLTNGVATVKIGRVPDKAKLKVKATYTGDAQYAAGAGKFKYTLI